MCERTPASVFHFNFLPWDGGGGRAKCRDVITALIQPDTPGDTPGEKEIFFFFFKEEKLLLLRLADTPNHAKATWSYRVV